MVLFGINFVEFSVRFSSKIQLSYHLLLHANLDEKTEQKIVFKQHKSLEPFFRHNKDKTNKTSQVVKISLHSGLMEMETFILSSAFNFVRNILLIYKITQLEHQ